VQYDDYLKPMFAPLGEGKHHHNLPRTIAQNLVTGGPRPAEGSLDMSEGLSGIVTIYVIAHLLSISSDFWFYWLVHET
jgi:hypothetical protein